jgi:hypothetical protein
MMMRRATALLALTSLLSAGLPAPAAAAPNATPFPVLFVTQVPIPYDFTTIASVFGNHLTAMDSVGRGGDLYIRYPDGTLKNLTALAGYGVATGFQGSTSIAVREPSVHWSGTKALFSMVIGAPPQQYQYVTRYWQIYEVTGLGQGDTPVITKVPNQPATFNNVSPLYASDDRVLFTSDRPRNGAAHLYPQLDEYEEAPTVTGIWSLAPATGDLRLLDHAPSGDFTPIVDSFGRVVFTRWDHLQRDQQADADAIGGGGYGTFNWSDESAASVPLPNRDEVYPEPRPERADLLAGTNLEGHTFNQFFPWMMNQDGTELEVLNHIGRHELHGYFNRSINDDANVREFIAETSGRFNPNEIEALLQIKESPVTPGRYFGIDAPEFYTHASGQVVSLPGQPGLHADQIAVTYHTHRSTSGYNGDGQPVPTGHSGHYRNPLPLADGTVLVAHTPETRADRNDGTRALPVSRYDFRLKLLQAGGVGGTQVAGAPLTPGIRKTLWFWDPDVRVDYVNALMWEIDPVEVRPRAVPPAPVPPLETPEATIFTQEGVDPAQFRQYLREKNLALTVSRDVTTRDVADRQQPFNLRVPGGVQTTGAGGKIYDVRYLQFFQADQLRGLGGSSSPDPGRRVLAQVMHAPEVTNPPNPTGPAGSVKVATDGSMAALVPASRALSWHLTSPTGVPVVRERYWLTMQAGEIRVCTSCHGLNSKDQSNSPVPTNPPEALREFLQYWKANLFVAAAVDDVSAVEGSAASPGTAVFSVSLNRTTDQTVTVPYSTANQSAASGSDYQPRTGTLTFAPGVQARTVSVPLVGDAVDEANKTFALNLGTPVNAFVADGQGLATIVDDDGPALSVGDTTVTEGGTTTTVQFTVSLASPAGASTTVGYATADVSATAGSDYVASSGTLTFAPGAVSTTVAVTVNGDALDEPDEYFALLLSGASNPIADGSGQGTIVDDDGGAASAYGGLVHGSARLRSLQALPGPVADTHRYVVRQDARSSYEVIVDAVSGDLQPLSLTRLSPGGTVVQTSTGSGVGRSRSLRWVNSTAGAVDGERIAVASGGCGTGCGADDLYRIRFYETTGLVSRFNNAGGQGTVLILQNPGPAAVTGQVYLWSAGGALLGSAPFTLPARGSVALNTGTVAGAAGQTGSITVAHDAPYGVLTGKAVALEPATGFSFDTPLVMKPR